MRIVVCPDSFKGSLAAVEAAEAIENGLRRVRADVVVTKVPMADGGEGTALALVTAGRGRFVPRKTWDPLLRPCVANLGWLSQNRALVELADASGYSRMSEDERTIPNALAASTYGTGKLIRDALDAGATEVYLTLGGSATTDGGFGIFGALSGVARDKRGRRLPTYRAQALESVDSIDISALHPRVREVAITIACDVDNPLCGADGAAYVYGPQKGLIGAAMEKRDGQLAAFANLVERACGESGLVRGVRGLGAAGGAALPLMAFGQARMVPGAVMVAEATHLEEAILSADLVITGEGRFDEQSLHGKVAWQVAALARKHGKPCAVIAGRVENGVLDPAASGLIAVVEASPKDVTDDEIRTHSRAWLAEAAARFLSSFETSPIFRDGYL